MFAVGRLALLRDLQRFLGSALDRRVDDLKHEHRNTCNAEIYLKYFIIKVDYAVFFPMLILVVAKEAHGSMMMLWKHDRFHKNSLLRVRVKVSPTGIKTYFKNSKT